jgi:hypothetical protein
VASVVKNNDENIEQIIQKIAPWHHLTLHRHLHDQGRRVLNVEVVNHVLYFLLLTLHQLMPYQNIEELADLVSRGEGSLVASVVKNNDENIHSSLVKVVRTPIKLERKKHLFQDGLH